MQRHNLVSKQLLHVFLSFDFTRPTVSVNLSMSLANIVCTCSYPSTLHDQLDFTWPTASVNLSP